MDRICQHHQTPKLSLAQSPFSPPQLHQTMNSLFAKRNPQSTNPHQTIAIITNHLNTTKHNSFQQLVMKLDYHPTKLNNYNKKKKRLYKMPMTIMAAVMIPVRVC
jgi:hypothetical protein